jgi:hypothetical protein
MANSHERQRPGHVGHVSFAAHEEEDTAEGEPLLQDAERADDEGGCYPPQNWSELAPGLNPHANLPIYNTLHR